MQYRRPKRPISGVLLLDKPAGFSSNQALQRAKHLYSAAKAGHTGNLDPFATGLLPICFGEATKFSQTLLDADKAYRAVLQLGATSTTGDTEGEIMRQAEMRQIQREDVEAAVKSFMGPVLQTPPMHSALKHQGKPLYEYARAGVEIERKVREIQIYDISLERYSGDQAEIFVRCSKGTYIRVLGEDVGKKLGCGAHLNALRRLETGGFQIEHALTFEALENMSEAERDQQLLPVDVLLQGLPSVTLDAESSHYFRQGQVVWKSGITTQGMFRAYGPDQVFLGLAENLEDGRIAPRRVLAVE